MHAVYLAMDPLSAAGWLIWGSPRTRSRSPPAVIAFAAAVAFATGTSASLRRWRWWPRSRMASTASSRASPTRRAASAVVSTPPWTATSTRCSSVASRSYVHGDVVLLGATLVALVGSFMVSYASSVERSSA